MELNITRLRGLADYRKWYMIKSSHNWEKNRRMKRSFNRVRDIAEVKRERGYNGYFKLDKVMLKIRCFDKTWSQVFLREVYQRRQAVGVLMYDPWYDTVVLVEQFRIGALDDRKSPWLYELVAGIVDNEHETKEETAIREAKEESGLILKSLMPIMEYWVSPGASNEYMTLYCACVDSRKASGVHGLKHEGEDIMVHVWPMNQAFALVEQGEVNNAPAIIALQWLQLNHQKLKQTWLMSEEV